MAFQSQNSRLSRRAIVAYIVVTLIGVLLALAWACSGKIAALLKRPDGGATNERVARATPPPGAGRMFFQPELLDGQRAYEEVADLVALGPRVSDTPGAQKAAEHIAARLKETGVHTAIDEFIEETAAGSTVFRNVVGTLQGDGSRIIVIGSHYDTRAGISDDFVGANDSGSSSGLLLELARVIGATTNPPATFYLVFFDGEECRESYSARDGLHGSCRFAEKLTDMDLSRKVLGFILLDMVGDKDLSVTIPLNSSPPLANLVLTAAREEGARDKFKLHSGSILDDHVPFLKARMQAVDIIDFQYGSTPGKNDYWHSADDTMDKLSPESLQTVGRVVLRMLNSMLDPAARR